MSEGNANNLIEENQRMRQALEFYGNEFNYSLGAEEIRNDFGQIARQALRASVEGKEGVGTN